MKARYFSDTDTLHLELSNGVPIKTEEIGNYLYVDYDSRGRIIGITIEHARDSAGAPDFSYQIVSADTHASRPASRRRRSA